MTHQVCLLLGSNIEPEVNIPRAVELLQEHLTILRASSTWESASSDCCYPNYLNLAVLVSTPLDVSQLKGEVLRPLEARMGRVRTDDKNASRTIDLDIILFDGECLDPELWQRVHIVMPVGELFPDYLSPSGERLQEIAQRLAHVTPIEVRKDVAVTINTPG